MTFWNTFGSPLVVNTTINQKACKKFLGTLQGNSEDEPLWEINDDGEIRPIDYQNEKPKIYVERYIEIVQWLKKKRLNCESGYAFTYENDEDVDDRCVGALNSNDKSVSFVQINGDGNIIPVNYDNS